MELVSTVIHIPEHKFLTLRSAKNQPVALNRNSCQMEHVKIAHLIQGDFQKYFAEQMFVQIDK